MSGHCPDCGNTQCICDILDKHLDSTLKSTQYDELKAAYDALKAEYENFIDGRPGEWFIVQLKKERDYLSAQLKVRDKADAADSADWAALKAENDLLNDQIKSQDVDLFKLRAENERLRTDKESWRMSMITTREAANAHIAKLELMAESYRAMCSEQLDKEISNLTRIQSEIDQLRKAYPGIMSPTIGIGRLDELLRDLIAALDAMPDKRLIPHDLIKRNEVDKAEFCTLGAIGHAKGIDMTDIDPYDHETLSEKLNIATQLVQEIEFLNDETCDSQPEKRWEQMRGWAVRRLKPAPKQESGE